jgi:hypothetical protein
MKVNNEHMLHVEGYVNTVFTNNYLKIVLVLLQFHVNHNSIF